MNADQYVLADVDLLNQAARLVAQRFDALLAERAELIATLKSLGRVRHDGEFCCCEFSLGNPMQTGHSAICRDARAVLAKAEGR